MFVDEVLLALSKLRTVMDDLEEGTLEEQDKQIFSWMKMLASTPQYAKWPAFRIDHDLCRQTLEALPPPDYTQFRQPYPMMLIDFGKLPFVDTPHDHYRTALVLAEARDGDLALFAGAIFFEGGDYILAQSFILNPVGDKIQFMGQTYKAALPIRWSDDEFGGALFGVQETDELEVAHHMSAQGIFGLLSLLDIKTGVKRETRRQPPRLQAKRVKKGKLPYMDYHELMIRSDVREAIVNHAGSERIDDVKQGNGEGMPRRRHWRRGHFKRCKTGTFFWSPHLVGGEGFAAKRYSVVPKGG